MSKRKQLEKELEIAKQEYKEAFDYISKITLDIEQCEKYMKSYLDKVSNIKKN